MEGEIGAEEGDYGDQDGQEQFEEEAGDGYDEEEQEQWAI